MAHWGQPQQGQPRFPPPQQGQWMMGGPPPHQQQQHNHHPPHGWQPGPPPGGQYMPHPPQHMRGPPPPQAHQHGGGGGGGGSHGNRPGGFTSEGRGGGSGPGPVPPSSSSSRPPVPSVSVALQSTTEDKISEDVRQVMQATAGHVAKLGDSFEKRILATNEGNVKFAFLLESSGPLHALYRAMVVRERAKMTSSSSSSTATSSSTTPFGGTSSSSSSEKKNSQQEQGDGSVVLQDPNSSKRHQAGGSQLDREQHPVIVSQKVALAIARWKRQRRQTASGEVQMVSAAGATLATESVVEIPQERRFIIRIPEGIDLYMMDLIKLTAQYVAIHGDAFAGAVIGREQRSPQFAFLWEHHPFHRYFQELLTQYHLVMERVADPNDAGSDRLSSRVLGWDGPLKSRGSVVNSLCVAFDKARVSEQAEREAQDSLETSIRKASRYDWDNFSVVGTITFDDDDADGDEDMDSQPDGASAKIESEQLRKADLTARARESGAVVPSAVKIVANIGDIASKLRDSSVQTQICPRCNQHIPVDEMADHMRIELHDPSYVAMLQRKHEEEQKRLSQPTRGGVSLPPTAAAEPQNDEIASAVLGFAQHRPDLFTTGDARVDAERRRANDEKMQREAAEARAKTVQWDGREHTRESAMRSARAMAEQAPPRTQGPPPPGHAPPRGPVSGPWTGGGPNMPPGPFGPPGSGLPPPMQGMPPHPMQGPPPMRGGMPPFGPPPGAPLVGLPTPPSGLVGLPPGPPGLVALPPPPQASLIRPRSVGDDWAQEDQPVTKRARVDAPKEESTARLIAEDAFVSSLNGALATTVTILGDRSAQKAFPAFKSGKSILLSNLRATDSVLEVKTRLSESIGVAPNKQKLNAEGLGWLKDNLTLAHYNLAGDVSLTLGSKERAKTKKG